MKERRVKSVPSSVAVLWIHLWEGDPFQLCDRAVRWSARWTARHRDETLSSWRGGQVSQCPLGVQKCKGCTQKAQHTWISRPGRVSGIIWSQKRGRKRLFRSLYELSIDRGLAVNELFYYDHYKWMDGEIISYFVRVIPSFCVKNVIWLITHFY